MCDQNIQMLTVTARAFAAQTATTLEPARKLGRDVHQLEKALTEILVKQLAEEDQALVKSKELLFVPMHLERVGDNIEFLIRAIHSMIQDGIPFTERAMSEVNTLFKQNIELLECVRDAVLTKNKVLMRHIVEQSNQLDTRVDECALLHQQRMIEGICVPKASSLYLAILDYLKGIQSHCRQIASKLLDQAAV
jgi:Na+/phosphate symporter